MTEGHRTSTIPRPEGAKDASRARVRPDAERRDDTRLVQRRRPRNVLALAGLGIALALAASLFVLPFKDWLSQRAELKQSRAELAELQAANDRLDAENVQLQTADGVAAAARTDLGYQGSNETAVAVLPPPAVAAILPTGWPYDQVTQILTVRAGEALRAAQAATATTVVAVTPTTGAAATPTASTGSVSPP